MPCNSVAVAVLKLSTDQVANILDGKQVEPLRKVVATLIGVPVTQVNVYERTWATTIYAGQYAITLSRQTGVSVSHPNGRDARALQTRLEPELVTFARMGAQAQLASALRKIGVVQSDVQQPRARVLRLKLNF